MAGLEKVIETRHGLRVEGDRHKPIAVTFEPTFIQVEAQPEYAQMARWRISQLENKRFGFYQYYDFSRHIGTCIAADWQRPEREGEDFEPGWLRPWKAKKEATYIGKEVHHLWKKHLERIDPLVLAAHRQVFASCGRACCDLVMDPELYRHKHIAGDIAKYRAAAIAAMHVDALAKWKAERRLLSTPEAIEIRQQLEDLQRRALECNLKIRGANVDYDDQALDVDDDLEALANWRGLFSYNGEPYRSLNRTLMNLPGNVPHGLVPRLAFWKLESPYTERLELLMCLLVRRNGENTHLIANARTPQIKEAMKRVAAHTGDQLTTRRYKDVKQVVDFLADFPERHTGNIVGLADKAIRWHRERLHEARERQIEQLGGDTETALPPIPLPEIPGVTFLDTVGAVCQEGAEMSHCIAEYARQAVGGHYFLFHIEHDGDRATAQMDYQGHVLQVHGPRNRRNGAARWGRRILRQWGRQFPEDAPRPMLNPPVYDDRLPF